MPDETALPIILIAAMTKNRVIGDGDRMPWDVPEEYQLYLDTIRDQTVIMGRRTYEIFGADLTCENTIVVSRGQPEVPTYVAGSLEESFELAVRLGKKIFVAGGQNIYEEALPRAGWMYLSTILEDHTGDKYFPEWDTRIWKIGQERGYARFVHRIWRRIAPDPIETEGLATT